LAIRVAMNEAFALENLAERFEFEIAAGGE
jgi:hypothetical protein